MKDFLAKTAVVLVILFITVGLPFILLKSNLVERYDPENHHTCVVLSRDQTEPDGGEIIYSISLKDENKATFTLNDIGSAQYDIAGEQYVYANPSETEIFPTEKGFFSKPGLYIVWIVIGCIIDFLMFCIPEWSGDEDGEVLNY